MENAFWPRFRAAELHYRLHDWHAAEQEIRQALDLASTPEEYAISRRYLLVIRAARRAGAPRPALVTPAVFRALLAAGLMLVLLAARPFMD